MNSGLIRRFAETPLYLALALMLALALPAPAFAEASSSQPAEDAPAPASAPGTFASSSFGLLAVQDDAETAQEQLDTQAAPAFEVGHVYAVPILFAKVGTDETSMAAQYFGDTANIRPRDNGTFDVLFSTNRPDYIESITHDGTPAAVTSDGASSREFSITIPRTDEDTLARLSLVVTPMKDLGVDSVDADLHLYLTRATDLGADTGQVAASTSGNASASASSSTGSASALPKTGDLLAPLAATLVIAALAAALIGGASLRNLAPRPGRKSPEASRRPSNGGQR